MKDILFGIYFSKTRMITEARIVFSCLFGKNLRSTAAYRLVEGV